MPTAITFPVLQSINYGVSTAFNDQLFSAKPVWKDAGFVFEANSTGAGEVYPRLDMLRGLREWIGDRVVQSLTQTTFTINNRTFEQTIGVRREDLEDDKYGILTPIAQQLGQNVAHFPDILISQLLLAGHTTAAYDGQNFFDTAHPDFTAAGAATTSLNYVSGSSPAWYLFDTSKVIKPVIYQTRRPFQIIPKFSMTDPQVFWSKEFEWGVDGRCNVGFGIWQLGYMSKAPLTHDNVVAAINTMAGYRRPDGTPMGIRPNVIVTGTSNYYSAAKPLFENDMQPGAMVIAEYGGTAPVALVPNMLKGVLRPIEYQWLN